MKALLTILFFICINDLFSQCNEAAPVTYNLTQTSPGEIYRPNGSAWKGGDTVRIMGTNYDIIEFYNIHGDACRPIVIIPATKLVTQGFRLKGGTSYVKVLGGDSAYGIKSIGGIGMEKVHHIHIENVECTGGNTGVSFRYDVNYADTMTWYPNYRMTKITFNNIWVHDVDGEGMYIGNTQPNGYTVTSSYSGLDTVIAPNRMDSVTISNCIVERTTWDGIQLSNARDGSKIFGNTVRDFGTLDISSQRAGIILGGSCSGNVYNNSVKRGTGNGIQIFGYGAIKVYGNTIDSVGTTAGHVNGEQSIYGVDYTTFPETSPKQAVEIYNNQINRPELRGAIFFYEVNDNAENINVHDNNFCIPSATESWQSIYFTLPPTPINTNNILSCEAPPPTAPSNNLRGTIYRN